MPEIISARDLLKEAEALATELKDATDDLSLVTRVRALGQNLRAVSAKGGLQLTEPHYHKAARIYSADLILPVWDSLGPSETNPIWYNDSLADLLPSNQQ